MMQAFTHWVLQHGYPGIFLLLVFGIVGLPIPDESILGFAGYMVYRGKLQMGPTFAAAFLGSVCGITLSYVLGRTLGLYLLHKYGKFFGVTQAKLDLVHEWFRKIGKWTLVLSYFVPAVRHLSGFVAGSSKLEFGLFAVFAYAGGLLWSLTFLSLGYFFGKKFTHLFANIHRGFVLALGLTALMLVVYYCVRQFRSKKSQPVILSRPNKSGGQRHG